MLREIWNRDSLCVTKMTLSINKPREGEDAMITSLNRDMARRAELALTMRYGNNSEEELCL
jgi:hypothetical protein